MRKYICLDVRPEYLLTNLKANIFYYTHPFNPWNMDKKGSSCGFIVNGNIYCEFNILDEKDIYVCCSLAKLKRFLVSSNIKSIFLHRKKEELETIEDLYIAVVNCGFTRKIDWEEYEEARRNLKSDFSKRWKFDDFNLRAQALKESHHPGDALIQGSRFGTDIILDMVSNRRMQPVPECLKEEITYWINNMLEEDCIDITEVRFLLHAKIQFEVVGSLYRSYQVEIIMVDKDGIKIKTKDFCLCDCSREMEQAMEEYFKNELFAVRKSKQQLS